MTPPRTGQSKLRRAGRVLPVVALLLASVVAPWTVGAAVATTSSTTSTDAERKVVYGNDSATLNTFWGDNSTTSLGVTADATGPMAELDDDGEMEVPYVKNGALKLVEPDGDVTTLVASGVGSYSLAVGDWDGDGNKSVFYSAGSSGKYLHRIEPLTGETQEFGVKAKGTGGLGDLDSDEALEIAFTGGSGLLHYVDDGGSIVETSWYAYGLGTPHDFDGDGNASVPVVDGSNNVELVSIAEGTATDLGVNSKKTSIGVANVTGDSTYEVLYLETINSPAEIKYVTLSGDSAYLHDESGARIEGDKYIGIASVLTAAPDITDYSVTNPTGREIEVSFNSSKNLTDITVEITQNGNQVATLTESEFDETGSGPYHYVGTYTASADGNYTATLTEAVGPDGMDGASNQSGTVSIQTPYPNVTNVTISDATDDDGYVAGGDEVNVTAVVENDSEITSVTADASAFGAGTVNLSHTSGDTYATTFTVDAADVPSDGQVDVSVTATNEYDHSDTNSSGTLFVDTTPPTADAGPDRTIEEGTEATLDGDGSSDNSQIVNYTWTFDDGTTVHNITAMHKYPDPGTYTPVLNVTDTVGHSDTDTVTVTVENVSEGEVNLAVTNATLVDATDDDGYVSDGDTLRVSAVVENDSEITEVRADASPFGAGTINLSHTSGDTYATNFTVNTSEITGGGGETAIQVTAVDNYTHVDTATTGTVFLDMAPPNADAGSNVTIEEDTRLVLDGSNSSDNGTITKYVWTFDDGTTVTGLTPAHTYSEPGTYTPSLTVTDAVGHNATDTVTVEVTNVEQNTETVTDVVYVDNDTANTTSNETETVDEQNATTTQTNVTLVSEQRITVQFENVARGEPLAVELRRLEGANESLLLERLRFVTMRDGDFSLVVSEFDDPPADVPHLSNRTGVNASGYFRINHTIANENLSRVQLTLVVPPGAASLDGEETLVLYRYHDGSWNAHEAEYVRTSAAGREYRVDLPGLSKFGVAVQRPVIEVVRTSVQTESVRVGREAVVTAVVENHGATRGTTTVTLTANGTSVASREISLEPGANRTITFTPQFGEPGSYTLRIGDADAGALTVTRTEQTTPNEGTSDGGSSLPILPGVVLLMLVGGISYWWRRQ